MKSALIVTCFDSYSYDVRVKYVETVLKNLDYKTRVLTADFEHRNKCQYNVARDNITLIHVPRYAKNLSCKRMYSHFKFAQKIYKFLKNSHLDLIYVATPPNFLFYYLNKYKRAGGTAKIIFDVGDMWPETFPISNKKKRLIALFFKIWISIRNKNIKCADGIIYECDLFEKYLKKNTKNIYSSTIYLCKEDRLGGKIEIKNKGNIEILRFAYIGSINNIIDIDLIVKFLECVNRKKTCELTIIGGGENAEYLKSNCMNKGITVVDYGIVYDDNKKREILQECQFGFNIMKESVFVGATMKSLEYFYWGIALVNNIPADTTKILEKYRCGININTANCQEIANKICEMEGKEIIEICENARHVYECIFSKEVIINQLQKFFKEIISNIN